MHIKIDGADATLDGKQTVLQMLNANGCSIEVPNVCYHPGLGPIETCDTCLVSVNGELNRYSCT
ncbi:2Fe-2S iron-sulfur cluster-binding protein [Peribacillus simplex]|uniref:2Fe-2S iron-sulfur cluster-binding protein n=1 Tax=Peribacillus simplex TaxID=1478 RepID=UPI0035D4404F